MYLNHVFKVLCECSLEKLFYFLFCDLLFPNRLQRKPKRKRRSKNFKNWFFNTQTGNDSLAGLSCERGAKIAEEFLKAQGIDVKIVIADTESSVETARLKAQKLIHNGVHILVGAFNSAVSAAVSEVAEKRKIPFIINLSAGNQLTEQGYHYTFRNFPTAKMFGEKSVHLMNDLFSKKMLEKKNIKPNATFMVLNDAYGQGMLESLKKADSEKLLPFEINNIIQFDYKAKDLSAEVAKAKALGADILLLVSRVNTTNLIIHEMIQQRFNPKLIVGPANQGFFEKQFYNLFEEKSDDLYTIHAWIDPTSKLTESATALFQNIYPDEIFELNVGFSLEALYVAARAHQNAGSFDSEKLRDALASINESEGIIYGGPISFDRKGQRQTIQLVALMNKKKSPKISFPKKVQEVEPVIPFPGF